MRYRFGVCMSAICAVLPGLAVLGPARADSFTIEDWDLGVLVYRDSDDYAADGSNIVVNPLIASYQVSLPSNPATFAAAQYDISWLVNYGSFNISAQLAAQDGSSVRSLASGTVYLQSDIELLLSVDALLNYNLSAYGLDGYLSFAVRNLTASQYILSEYRWYSTFSQPPGSGVLSMNPSVVLPAEHEFRIQYQMLVQTSGYSQNLASAAGYTNWTLASIPEPATLALLAPLILIRPRRACLWRH